MHVLGFALLLCGCTCVQIKRSTSVSNITRTQKGYIFSFCKGSTVPNIRKWTVCQLYSQLLCRTDIARQIDANAPNSKICQRRPCLVLDAFNWPCLRNCKHSANGQTFTPWEGKDLGREGQWKPQINPAFDQLNKRGVGNVYLDILFIRKNNNMIVIL